MRYTLLHESHKTGKPIVGPMVYYFQSDILLSYFLVKIYFLFSIDINCVQESFNFMLGSQLLVAGVLHPIDSPKNGGMRKVYLPKGFHWCEFDSGVCWLIILGVTILM